jgi:hypothetical protein
LNFTYYYGQEGTDMLCQCVVNDTMVAVTKNPALNPPEIRLEAGVEYQRYVDAVLENQERRNDLVEDWNDLIERSESGQYVDISNFKNVHRKYAAGLSDARPKFDAAKSFLERHEEELTILGVDVFEERNTLDNLWAEIETNERNMQDALDEYS